MRPRDHSRRIWTVIATAMAAAVLVIVLHPGGADTHAKSLPRVLPTFNAQASPAAQLGFSRLDITGTDQTTLTVTEPGQTSTRPVTVVVSNGRATVERAVTWRCDLRVRNLLISDGTATQNVVVHTPSCATRLRLRTAKNVASGALLRIRLIDRWAGSDLAARLCMTAPGARARCSTVTHRAGQPSPAVHVRTARPGRWGVAASTRYGHVRNEVDVHPRGGRLRMLAAGDSEMQLLDDFLASALGGKARVHKDARVSTGISSPRPLFDWLAHARRQGPSLRPDVTVMFIGGNDGFSLRSASGVTVPCCGGAWVSAFGARAATMMRAYARKGAGRVYWFLLPIPRRPLLQRYFRAINQGYRLAAHQLPDDVHLIDAAHVFTPNGYRDTMTYAGRTFRIHESDGYHLSIAGDRVATRLVLAAMRSDHIL